MKTLLYALLLVSLPAWGEQLWLSASVGSYHFERKGYCEWNAGAGFEYGTDKYRLVAGTYQNSLCYHSNYVGVSWAPLQYKRWRAGVALIGVTGYKVQLDRKTGDVSDDPVFAPLPMLSYEGRTWGVNFLVIPPYEDFRGAAGVQVKVRF